jgi:hypothetical protein
MDGSSFNSSNFILIEEIKGDCPSGTTPLSPLSLQKENTNIFAKTFASAISSGKKYLPEIFGRASLAFDPDPTYTFCAVSGSASAEQVGALGEAGAYTKLHFQPSGALDPDKIYFAVVKGAQNLADNSTGVRSSFGISLYNMPSSRYQVINISKFDGVSYPNSFIWSFQTKQTNGEDDGTCAIAYLNIAPDSYLFNTAQNSLIENDDNPQAKTFDTINDSDKVFTASALAADGQELFPTTGYAWDWSWSFVGNNIATFINPVPFAVSTSSQLIRANANVADDQTKARAAIRITDSKITDAGDNLASTSDIYVFMCANTWPAMTGGTWHPWRDTVEGATCNPNPDGSCSPMNYQLYYCRDNGTTPLPEIQTITTRGATLNQGILKETYFFNQ